MRDLASRAGCGARHSAGSCGPRQSGLTRKSVARGLSILCHLLRAVLRDTGAGARVGEVPSCCMAASAPARAPYVKALLWISSSQVELPPPRVRLVQDACSARVWDASRRHSAWVGLPNGCPIKQRSHSAGAAAAHLRVRLHRVGRDGQHLDAPGLILPGQLSNARLQVHHKWAAGRHAEQAREGKRLRHRAGTHAHAAAPGGIQHAAPASPLRHEHVHICIAVQGGSQMKSKGGTSRAQLLPQRTSVRRGT